MFGQCCGPISSLWSRKAIEAAKPIQEAPKPEVKKGPPGLGSLTLQSITHEYDKVSTWHFVPDQKSTFEAGMMLHMIAPGIGLEGPFNNENVRHLSFASAPKENKYSFAMDVASGTGFKNRMDALKPGDKTLFFKSKFKHFKPQWTAESNDVVFLAGGIGITPIRSLILEHGDKMNWQLVHVARDNKFLFGQELGALGSPMVKTNRAGAAAAVAAAVAQKPKAWFYVCGSDRFMKGMMEVLKQGGVPEDMIKAESFE